MAPKKKRKGGRTPERLRIEADWKDAIAKALKRGKPPDDKTPKKPKGK